MAEYARKSVADLQPGDITILHETVARVEHLNGSYRIHMTNGYTTIYSELAHIKVEITPTK